MLILKLKLELLTDQNTLITDQLLINKNNDNGKIK